MDHEPTEAGAANERFRELSRRRLLQLGLVVPVGLFVACSSDEQPSAVQTTPGTGAPTTPAATAPTTLTPTPTCDDGDDATLAQTEGPYFTPNSPERASLLGSGIDGTRLLLTGAVVGTDCTPVARALVDFWQANDAGEYDNSGYNLRGHQFTDAQGRYSLTTIMPGIYTGRTRHIHVKVQAPNQPVLTTQLYFPGEPANASDGIYREECEIDIANAGSGKAGTFTFVLDL
jgi:protocatechuate 3,4-dioxygenase beta subunit